MAHTNKIDLHAEQISQKGFPLLMLHGWGQSSEALKSLGTLLSSKCQVHLADLPGFGRSSPPDEVWNSFQYAERFIKYLDEQNISQTDLLGHSFGGKVAMSLASRFPDRVRKLTLIAPSGLRRKRTWTEQCRYQAIRWSGKGIKAIDKLLRTNFFKQNFAPRFGSADYKQAGPMRSILVKSVNEDLSEHILMIKAPTLILWGEDDRETPLEMAKRLHRLISNSRLLVFPGKGHQLYHDAGSHLCAYHILPFLSENI